MLKSLSLRVINSTWEAIFSLTVAKGKKTAEKLKSDRPFNTHKKIFLYSLRRKNIYIYTHIHICSEYLANILMKMSIGRNVKL